MQLAGTPLLIGDQNGSLVKSSVFDFLLPQLACPKLNGVSTGNEGIKREH